MGVAPLRVAICEDSAVYADGLRLFLEADGDIRVCAVYESAEEMLRSLRRDRPDLLVVDLELPRLSGTEAIRRVMRSSPLPILVISAHAQRGSRHAAEALAHGALEARPKSAIRLADRATLAAAAFRRHVKRLARARVAGARAQDCADLPPGVARPATVIGVAASTGGPAALEAMLGALPADFRIPVMVVQHMTSGFVDGLASWLDGAIPLPVALAEDRARLGPGVWLAPDGAHLEIDGGRIRLAPERGKAMHVPSGDALMSSIARSAGRLGVGVVLTGMGRDAAAGLAALHDAGGLAIVQDAHTSVIDGMPRAAAAAAGIDLALPPERIAQALLALRAADLRTARSRSAL